MSKTYNYWSREYLPLVARCDSLMDGSHVCISVNNVPSPYIRLFVKAWLQVILAKVAHSLGQASLVLVKVA